MLENCIRICPGTIVRGIRYKTTPACIYWRCGAGKRSLNEDDISTVFKFSGTLLSVIALRADVSRDILHPETDQSSDREFVAVEATSSVSCAG